MTTEEKAKAYEMALEAARKELGCDRKEYKVVEPVLKSIFPELRESEDERIRKEAISIVQSYMNICDKEGDPCLSGYKVLAYLEKQKYDRMKPIYDARESFESALEKAWNDYHNGYENVDKLEDDYVECAHAKGFREGYLFGIEKQKEQKPAATINGEPISTENNSVNIPLAEWSEEDEKMLSDLRNTLGCLMNAGAITFKTKKKFSNWLKSLRPQPKQEWSEEDENALKYLHELISFGFTEKFFDAQTAADMREWLNTRFKPLRPSWKPSEEQMEALNYAIAEWDGGKRLEGLYALRNDLKKLI